MTLRHRTEQLARDTLAQSPEGIEALSREDLQRTLHELRVHQIELERRNEALRERLDRSLAIIDDSLDWQSWFGLDGRYLWVNPAVEQLTGYTPEEVMAMPDWVSVLIAEEDWPIFAETFRDAIGGSQGTGFEIRYVRKDGVKRWISVDWKPVVDAQGKPLGTRASGRDITDLKRTEEALRRSQSMLARTEAITHVGSWEWDIATDTVTWSDELFRLFQRDPVEGAPSFADHLQRYISEDQRRLKDAVKAALHHGTPYELELRASRTDGTPQILMTAGHADIDTDERVTRLFGFIQDVTKRRAAERAQRDSEQLFRAMFVNAPLNILIHDADTGEMVDANPTACALYGFDSVEALKAASDQLWLEPPYSVDDAVQMGHQDAAGRSAAVRVAVPLRQWQDHLGVGAPECDRDAGQAPHSGHDRRHHERKADQGGLASQRGARPRHHRRLAGALCSERCAREHHLFESGLH